MIRDACVVALGTQGDRQQQEDHDRNCETMSAVHQ